MQRIASWFSQLNDLSNCTTRTGAQKTWYFNKGHPGNPGSVRLRTGVCSRVRVPLNHHSPPPSIASSSESSASVAAAVVPATHPSSRTLISISTIRPRVAGELGSLRTEAIYLFVSLDLLWVIHFPCICRDPKEQLRGRDASLKHRADMLLGRLQRCVPAWSARAAIV